MEFHSVVPSYDQVQVGWRSQVSCKYQRKQNVTILINIYTCHGEDEPKLWMATTHAMTMAAALYSVHHTGMKYYGSSSIAS